MNLVTVPLRKPDGVNLILGQSHFIKTVEDLHEALVSTVPGIRFGLAFCESSGPALVRWSGTDAELTDLARTTMLELGNAFPINVLPAVRAVPEVCHVFCATANPVEVVVAETEHGRGILGVVDGVRSRGVETEADVAARTALLRDLGYKAR